MSAILVTDVTITPVAIADPPLRNAWGIHQPFALRAVLEVRTDGGLIGLSETYGDDATLADLRRCLSAVIGLDVFQTVELERRLRAVLGADAPRERDGQPRRAPQSQRLGRCLAAFEVAMSDLQGKVAERPLAALLGGPARESVDYAGYLFFKPAVHHPVHGLPADRWGEALDGPGIVEQARQMVSRFGFRSLKLKGGVLPPEEELAVITELHAAFPELALRYDPNAAWSLDTALAMVPRFEGLLQYMEDPTPGVEGMARVRAATSLPLATNMVVTELGDLAGAVRHEAVDIVLADHHFWGGVAASRRLGAVCGAFGLGMSMHSNTHLGISLAAMTHIAAAIPELDFACDTHRPWLESDILLDDPLPLRDGSVVVPSGPGLGVELDREALERHHQEYLRCGIRTRDDAAEMRRSDPSFSPSLPRF